MMSCSSWSSFTFGIILFCSWESFEPQAREQRLAKAESDEEAIRFIMMVAVVFFLPAQRVARLCFSGPGALQCLQSICPYGLHVQLQLHLHKQHAGPPWYIIFSSPSFPKFYTKLKICSLRPRYPGCFKRPEDAHFNTLLPRVASVWQIASKASLKCSEISKCSGVCTEQTDGQNQGED